MVRRDLKIGDVVRFKSGPRRVVAVWTNGIQLVQLRDGFIGGGHFHKRKVADGKTLTTYTWWDLDRMLR